MIYSNWQEINSLAVRAVGKPAVYVSNGLEYTTPEDDKIWCCIQNEMRNIYGDKTTKFYDVMSGLVSGGMFFFEDSGKAYSFYKVFELLPVDSSAVYACLYDRVGSCETENTNHTHGYTGTCTSRSTTA